MGFFTEKNGDLRESTVIGLGVVVPILLGAFVGWGLYQAANDPTFHLLPTLPGYQPTPTPTPDVMPTAGSALLLSSGIALRRTLHALPKRI